MVIIGATEGLKAGGGDGADSSSRKVFPDAVCKMHYCGQSSHVGESQWWLGPEL